MTNILSAPKGTHDILPEDTPTWRLIESVSREVMENCIAAAGRAPSGANHQPWFFGLVGDPGLKREIRLAAEEEERAFYGGRAGP